MNNDPYEILGVSRNSATAEDIKRAFHKLAHIHHPDKGGDITVFKKISQAYSQIKDKGVTQTQSHTENKFYTKSAADFKFNTSFTYSTHRWEPNHHFSTDFMEAILKQQLERQKAYKQAQQKAQEEYDRKLKEMKRNMGF